MLSQKSPKVLHHENTHTNHHLRGRHVVARLSRTTSSRVISGDISLTKPTKTSHFTKHINHAMYVTSSPLFLRRMDRPLTPSIEATAIDTHDIQRALNRPIRGKGVRPAYLDSVTFNKIKSWPSGVALHGGQELAMVEEQYGIRRPFGDAVKQTLE